MGITNNRYMTRSSSLYGIYIIIHNDTPSNQMPKALYASILISLLLIVILSGTPVLRSSTYALFINNIERSCISFSPNPHGLRLKLLHHGEIFSVVSRCLQDAFDHLGIAYEAVTNMDVNDETSTYIICHTHEPHALPPRYISYNLEQLTAPHDNASKRQQLLDRFRGAYEVWDYSSVNIAYLRSHGIDAKLVRFGYCPSMTTKYTQDLVYENKTVDFLFVGWVNEMRREKMKPIVDLYTGGQEDRYIITDRAFIFQDDLHRAYAQSKVSLNIHFYTGATILEVHRIVPMVANKVWVMSEHSDDPWYDEEYRDLVDFIDDTSDPDFLRTYKEILVLDGKKFMETVDKRLALLQRRFAYVDYVKSANTSVYSRNNVCQ